MACSHLNLHRNDHRSKDNALSLHLFQLPAQAYDAIFSMTKMQSPEVFKLL